MLPQLLEIARAAGEGVMEIYGASSAAGLGGDYGSLAVSPKADNSPVTQADLRAHEIIVEGLAKLAPAIPVVSEEDTDSLRHRTPDGLFWLIDPLDGTREFIARNDEFTVNIALISGGVAVLGVVFAPALDLLYWGGADFGAFRDASGKTERIAVAGNGQSPCAIRVVASKSHMNAETSRFIMALGPHELIQAGSSLKFCRIAEGAADIYPRLGPTCEWDTAAAQAIVEAAGGHVSTLDGARLRYGKTDVLNPHFIARAAALHELGVRA